MEPLPLFCELCSACVPLRVAFSFNIHEGDAGEIGESQYVIQQLLCVLMDSSLTIRADIARFDLIIQLSPDE